MVAWSEVTVNSAPTLPKFAVKADTIVYVTPFTNVIVDAAPVVLCVNVVAKNPAVPANVRVTPLFTEKVAPVNREFSVAVMEAPVNDIVAHVIPFVLNVVEPPMERIELVVVVVPEVYVSVHPLTATVPDTVTLPANDIVPVIVLFAVPLHVPPVSVRFMFPATAPADTVNPAQLSTSAVVLLIVVVVVDIFNVPVIVQFAESVLVFEF